MRIKTTERKPYIETLPISNSDNMQVINVSIKTVLQYLTYLNLFAVEALDLIPFL